MGPYSRVTDWRRPRLDDTGHAADLVRHRLRQPQRLAHDLVDLLAGRTFDHQLALFARREELRILKQRSKCGAQRA
jgi:hypothetical protein